MITKELQLNGQPTDLTEIVAVTVKGPDLAEMRSGAAYSNTFKLPYTRKNSVATGNAGNTNITPSGSGVPASLTIGGVDALSGSGQAFVRGSDREGYSVDVKGGAYTFFDLLKNTQLVDLPGWDAYDFLYNNTEIIARTGVSTDICFPVLDFGRTSGSTYGIVGDTGVVQAYPVIRTQFLIAFMCNALGYELVQEPASDAWPKLAIPFNLPTFQNGKRYFAENTVTATGTSGTWTGTLQATGALTYFYTQVPGGGVTSGPLDMQNLSCFIDNLYASLTIVAGASYMDMRLEMYQGAAFPGSGSPIASVTVKSWPAVPSTADFSLANLRELNAGTVIRTFLVIEADGPGVVSWSTSWDSSRLEIVPKGTITKNGYYFTVEAMLPDMSCAEMMRATLMQAGAFITVDEQAKQVSIMAADQVAAIEGFASDWGRKFADTMPVPMATDYRGFRATNYLRFTEDGDVAKQLGDGEFSVTTGDGQSGTYLTSPFSPSPRTVTFGVQCAQVLHWQLATDSSSFQEYSTSTVRILALQQVPGLVTYRVNGTNTVITDPTIAVFQDYYGLGYEATLDYVANGVYQTVARWANEGRRFTAKFLLSLNDIQSMHLMQTVAGYNLCGILRPVHVSQLGATCLIESISQWVDEETPCEVTLLKIG